MAYDRNDRDERSRWSGDRDSDRFRRDERSYRDERRGRDERGFFERAGDEIASWFGDDDAEHGGHPGDRPHGHERERGESSAHDRESRGDDDRDRGGDWNENRGVFARGGSSERDYSQNYRRDLSRGGDRERDYRPMAGDYGRSEESFAASGVGRGERGSSSHDRSHSPWGRDEYRRTSEAGSRDKSRNFDPHYHSWREQHLSELDRDYEDFRRENQSRFESEFATWRERRQHKRGLLGQIREQMDVVGSDEQLVGTVDRVSGDRIVLTKSDPESGGAHHSLSCSDIDRVEGDRVILECSADQARGRWRDERRSRALFEREDQGEMGPRVLDQSFEGTYR